MSDGEGDQTSSEGDESSTISSQPSTLLATPDTLDVGLPGQVCWLDSCLADLSIVMLYPMDQDWELLSMVCNIMYDIAQLFRRGRSCSALHDLFWILKKDDVTDSMIQVLQMGIIIPRDQHRQRHHLLINQTCEYEINEYTHWPDPDQPGQSLHQARMIAISYVLNEVWPIAIRGNQLDIEYIGDLIEDGMRDHSAEVLSMCLLRLYAVRWHYECLARRVSEMMEAQGG